MSLKVSKQAVQTDVLPSKRFDYSHRSQSSLNFGELSIATSFEMIPNSSFDMDFAQIVRASTMVSPTFGKMSHDAWGVFVPYRSVLPWFPHLMTNTSYALGVRDSIGHYNSSVISHRSIPEIMVKQLTALCCIGAECVVFRRGIKLMKDPEHSGKVIYGDVSNLLVPMHPSHHDDDGYTWNDVDSSVHDSWATYYPPSSTGGEYVFGYGSLSFSRQRWMNVNNSSVKLPFWDDYVGNYMNINYMFTGRASSREAASDLVGNMAYFAVPLGKYQLRMSPESCDFLLPLNSFFARYAGTDNHDVPDFSNPEHMDYVIGFRMSGAGKRLYKLLRGLGYDLNLASEEKVSILPLLCAMRAYWDLFGVVRTRNFEESHLHSLITAMNNTYRTDMFLHHVTPNGTSAQYNNMWDTQQTDPSDFWYCVKELFNFFVTDDTDFISSHLQSAFYDSPLGDAPPNVGDITINSSAGWFDVAGVDFGNGSADMPIASIETIRHSALSEALLKIMFKFTNRYSELGQAIAARLRADGHGKYVDNMPVDFVGHTSLDLNVTDVNATSDSSNEVANSFVGDVAGKSVSGGKSKHWKYHANEFGMFIVFDAIVPRSDYVQISCPWTRELSRFDFHCASFDSVDYQQSTKGSLFGYPQMMDASEQPQLKGFGFIPRFFDKKFRPSIINGEFAFPSTDAALLPFSLQKVLPINRVMAKSVGSIGSEEVPEWLYQLTLNYDNLPIAGDVWRYIYRAGWQGMLNRIFLNTDPQDTSFLGYVKDDELGYLSEKVFYCSPMRDNWYLDMLFTCNYYAPMKPVLDSSLDLTGQESKGTPMKQQ